MTSRIETSMAIVAAVGVAGALHLAPRLAPGLAGLGAPAAQERGAALPTIWAPARVAPQRVLCVADAERSTSNMSISHHGSDGSFKIVVRDGLVVESSADGVYTVEFDDEEVRVLGADGQIAYRANLKGGATPEAPMIWQFGDRPGRTFVAPGGRFAPRAPGDNRPRLGVGIEDVDGALAAQLGLAEGEGLVITSVAEGSAAAKAGVQKHDILTRLDGKSPVTLEVLLDTLAQKKAGDEVSLRVLRAGKTVDLVATLQAPPEEEGGWGFGFGDVPEGAGGEWEAIIADQMRLMEEQMRRFEQEMERMGLDQEGFGLDMGRWGEQMGRWGGDLGRLGGLMGEAGGKIGEAINADVESQLRSLVPRMMQEEVERLGGLDSSAARTHLAAAAGEAGAELADAAHNLDTDDEITEATIHFKMEAGAQKLAGQTIIALEKAGAAPGRADQATIEGAAERVVQRLDGTKIPLSAQTRAIVREQRGRMRQLEEEMHDVERKMEGAEQPEEPRAPRAPGRTPAPAPAPAAAQRGSGVPA